MTSVRIFRYTSLTLPDALLGGLSVTPKPPQAPTNVHRANNDLDDLLNDFAPAPPKPAANKNSGLDDIDALLSDFGSSTTRPAPAKSSGGGLEDIDDLLAGIGGSAPPRNSRRGPTGAGSKSISYSYLLFR
jgi:hypothetical protein